MKVFFDTEFTGLHKKTSLISIGLVTETNLTFYAECAYFKTSQCDAWIKKNIIANLLFYGKYKPGYIKRDNGNVEMFSESRFAYDLAFELSKWLKAQGQVEMWSDCLAYDWVLFNDIWGHAFNIPKNVYYIPFDICTLFKMKGIDPDINREKYSDVKEEIQKHNSLFDALVIKKCYEKIVS